MHLLKNLPGLYVLLFALVGICMAPWIPSWSYWIYVIFSVAVLVWIGVKFGSSKSKRVLLAAIQPLILILFGIVLQHCHQAKVPSADGLMQSEYYLVQLASEGSTKGTMSRFVADVELYRCAGSWHRESARIYLSLPGASGTEWYYGQRCLIKGAPRYIEGPHNPGEFDFRSFALRKGISIQDFVTSARVQRLEGFYGNPLVLWIYRWRAYLSSSIHTYIGHESSASVLEALVVGVKSHLESEIKFQYSATGAMHILSVSGLHVGIVYALISYLISQISILKKSKVAAPSLSLGGVWAYALITGAEAAVVRAALMISFVLVGKLLQRKSGIYNSIFFSAFFQLCLDPNLWSDVGFQLSYSAVLGIVYLQPILSNAWHPSNWIWKWVWGLFTVTIAAQLATFPLGLYYFNQFPTYFLVTNFLVIPLSTLVLYGGILMVLVSGVPLVATWVGKIVYYLVHGMNTTVHALSSLPWAVYKVGGFEVGHLLLVYAAIIAMLVFIRYHQFIYYVMGLMAMMGLGIVSFINELNIQKHESLVIFHSRKEDIIHWYKHGTCYTLYIQDSQKQQVPTHARVFQKYMSKYGYKREREMPVYSSPYGTLFEVGDKFWLHTTLPQLIRMPNAHLHTLESIIVQVRSKWEAQKLLALKPCIRIPIIITGSSPDYVHRIFSDASDASIYSTRLSGAYISTRN